MFKIARIVTVIRCVDYLYSIVDSLVTPGINFQQPCGEDVRAGVGVGTEGLDFLLRRSPLRPRP